MNLIFSCINQTCERELTHAWGIVTQVAASLMSLNRPNHYGTQIERDITLITTHKNPEIAQRLYLSPKTVRNHVSNILHKLQVADRTEAIIRAREAGLG